MTKVSIDAVLDRPTKGGLDCASHCGALRHSVCWAPDFCEIHLTAAGLGLHSAPLRLESESGETTP